MNHPHCFFSKEVRRIPRGIRQGNSAFARQLPVIIPQFSGVGNVGNAHWNLFAVNPLPQASRIDLGVHRLVVHGSS